MSRDTAGLYRLPAWTAIRTRVGNHGMVPHRFVHAEIVGLDRVKLKCQWNLMVSHGKHDVEPNRPGIIEKISTIIEGRFWDPCLVSACFCCFVCTCRIFWQLSVGDQNFLIAAPRPYFDDDPCWRYKILIRFTMERYDVAVNQDHSKAALSVSYKVGPYQF